MLEDKTILKVSNRDNGSVGYTIPDLGNLHRTFQPGETKEVTMGELRKLSYLPGGLNILKNLLIRLFQDLLVVLLIRIQKRHVDGFKRCLAVVRIILRLLKVLNCCLVLFLNLIFEYYYSLKQLIYY